MPLTLNLHKTSLKKKNIYIYIIYSIEYSSAIKKSETMPFAATWVELDIIIPSEVSQTKTNIIWYHLYMESFQKKDNTHQPMYKTEIDPQTKGKKTL